MDLKKSLLLFILFTLSPGAVISADNERDTSTKLKQSVWNDIGKEYNVDPFMLYSIALAESRRTWKDGKARPWPWTINSIKHGPMFFDTEAAAVETLERIIFQEKDKKVAIGLMQIYYAANSYLLPSPRELIKPVNNIRVGAIIYRDALIVTNNDQGKALGLYNSGKPMVTDYSRQVLGYHSKIKKQLGKDFWGTF